MDSQDTIISLKLLNLKAITPIDGRYAKLLTGFSEYFSESAYIKYRVKIELLYLVKFVKEVLKDNEIDSLNLDSYEISDSDLIVIKNYEDITNHDVKAIEYFIRNNILKNNEKYENFVHFALTSQDANNPAITLMLYDFMQKIYYPKLEELINKLKELADSWTNIKMLSYTHGQPAIPATLSHQLLVFIERLEDQLELLKAIPHKTKCGGAVGTLSAHFKAFPDVNWEQFMNEFIESLRPNKAIKRQRYTTQIESYDLKAAIFDNIKRINTILIDMARDFWSYISKDYLKLKVIEQEVGSSAMPHKVNPIDFENAEGNLGFGNSNCEFMSSKLPVSRLQRDLTDSTVLRNLGLPFSYTFIAMNNLIKGLNKITPNEHKIRDDLTNNHSVVSEAIQTILKREGFKNPYELLKRFTRGHSITKEVMDQFIKELPINNSVKDELLAISPFNL